MRDRTKMVPDGRGGGEELEGVAGKETIIRVCYVKKICFLWKEKILNKEM